MEEAVINSTVLIMLAKIRKFDLLNVYNKFTTQKVKDEVLSEKEIPEQERKDLDDYIKNNIKIINPEKEIDLDLDVGENSAISLCIEKNIKLFLSDDRRARKVAKKLSIKILGTIGLVLKNLEERKIRKQEAKNLLNLLIINSYYISTDIYANILEKIENN